MVKCKAVEGHGTEVRGLSSNVEELVFILRAMEAFGRF